MPRWVCNKTHMRNDSNLLSVYSSIPVRISKKTQSLAWMCCSKSAYLWTKASYRHQHWSSMVYCRLPFVNHHAKRHIKIYKPLFVFIWPWLINEARMTGLFGLASSSFVPMIRPWKYLAVPSLLYLKTTELNHLLFLVTKKPTLSLDYADQLSLWVCASRGAWQSAWPEQTA